MSQEKQMSTGSLSSNQLARLVGGGVRIVSSALKSIVTHPLFRLTLVGLAIRLALAPITQFTYDPVVWYSAGNDMLAGLSPYYTKTYSFPPLWAYSYFPFLLAASLLFDPRSFAVHVSQLDWISLNLGYSSTVLSPVFLLAIKLPLIIGDIATGFLLYRLVKGYSGLGLARAAYILWLFNPFVIWTSSVHASFDVLPAMFTLLSLILLIRSRYLPAGISLAIAVLYKLYPLYLLPLYIVLVWTDLGRARSIPGQLSNRIRRLAVFAGGGVIPFFVSLPFLSVPDMLHATLTRQAYLSSLGGLTPWMLNYAPGLGGIWMLVARNQTLIQLSTSGLALAISGLAGWFIIRKGQASLRGLLQANVLGISAIYLTLVTVNPQYVIWILPFLTVGVCTSGLFKKRTAILSGVALLWQVGTSGPLVFLPLTYLGVNVESITSPVQSFLVKFGASANPALLACGILGGGILLSFLLRQGWAGLSVPIAIPLPRMSPAISSLSLRKTLRSAYTLSLLVFLCGMVVSASLVHVATTSQFRPAQIDSRVNGGTLLTQDSFIASAGNLPLHLNLVAAPVSSLSTDRPVYIYFDNGYQSLGNDPRGWTGVVDHLPAELRLRGYSGPVRIVNATLLRQVMTQNSNSTIVIPSGAFPSNVENATVDLVGPWLRSGGTLVWMGGAFGFYVAHQPQVIDQLEGGIAEGTSAETRILGYRLVTTTLPGTARIASVPTSFSQALNLTYADVWVAPTMGLLRSVGGVAMGYVQNSSDTARSSISLIPAGAGKIFLLGGPVTSLLTADGEDVVAHDLAQILSLGELVTSAGIRYTTFNIPAGTSASLDFTASFNISSISVNGLDLVAFSDYAFSRLYWKTQVSV